MANGLIFGIDLKYFLPCLTVRVWHVNNLIKSPWPQQGHINDVNPVSCGYYYYTVHFLYAIHFRKELRNNSFGTTMSTATFHTSSSDGSYRINFIKENNTRRSLSCPSEYLSYTSF